VTGRAVARVARSRRARYTHDVTDAARKLLADVMALAPADRARVASALIASLDADEDTDAEQVWAAEIERRADRVLAGDSTGQPWDEVRARLVARVSKR
jgi:putative addiction module component (TIGR02574 family)